MAEKYGTIPKAFTRNWWGYFWEYYKWHTVAVLFAIFFVVSMARSIFGAEKFDLSIVHFGNAAFVEDNTKILLDKLEKTIEDADKNGENHIELRNLEFLGDDLYMDAASKEQFNTALYSKFFLSFTDDKTFVYLVDTSYIKFLKENDTLKNYFLPIDRWGFAAEKNLAPQDGGDFAISLDNNAFLKELGCADSKLCILLKPCIPEDEEIKKAFENGKSVIKYILQTK